MQGKKVKGKLFIDGTPANLPVGWPNIEVLATFDNEAVQANISIDKFTFVNAEATMLLQKIADGLTNGNGIFEGVPAMLQLYNEYNTANVFDGMIDLSDGLEIEEKRNKVSCKLKLKTELMTLEERLRALTFSYLESLNVFTNSDYSDVEYIVKKRINVLETITATIAIYILTKELIEVGERIPKDAANITAHATGGVTGPAGAAVYAIAVTILDLIYSAAIIVSIVRMGSTLLTQLIPVKRTAKCLNFRTALTKIAAYIGWGFSSNIADIDSVYYLPSNYNFDDTDTLGIISQWKGTTKGIPNTGDYGYNCGDFFELARKLFNGKFAIINGTLNFYNKDDMFWSQQASYVMPNVLNKVRSYNTEELVANRLYSFEVDYTDEHTIEQYQGTSFQVVTDAIQVGNVHNKNIRGLEEVRFGVALAKRKDEQYGIENLLQEMAQVVDGVVNFFGGNSNFVGLIGSSIGLIVLGSNNYALPKVLKLDSNMRHVDGSHSAYYLYDTYYKGTSFLQTINGIPYYGQKIVYRGVKIPFGMDAFISLINNSMITTDDGKQGRVMSIKWCFNSNTALVDYFIREPYTKNLKEIYIEPTNQ